MTDERGVAEWQPPADRGSATPDGWVVSAAPAAAGGRPLLAVVDQDEEQGSGRVVVRVWDLSVGQPVLAPDVEVHLLAVPR